MGGGGCLFQRFRRRESGAVDWMRLLELVLIALTCVFAFIALLYTFEILPRVPPRPVGEWSLERLEVAETAELKALLAFRVQNPSKHRAFSTPCWKFSAVAPVAAQVEKANIPEIRYAAAADIATYTPLRKEDPEHPLSLKPGESGVSFGCESLPIGAEVRALVWLPEQPEREDVRPEAFSPGVVWPFEYRSRVWWFPEIWTTTRILHSALVSVLCLLIGGWRVCAASRPWVVYSAQTAPPALASEGAPEDG